MQYLQIYTYFLLVKFIGPLTGQDPLRSRLYAGQEKNGYLILVSLPILLYNCKTRILHYKLIGPLTGQDLLRTGPFTGQA